MNRPILAFDGGRTELDRLKATLEQMPVAVAVLEGPDHVYAFTNAAHDRLLAGQPLRGRRVSEAVPEAEEQGLIALMDNVYRTGVPYEVDARELLFKQSDGTSKRFFLKFSYQPLRSGDGAVFGIGVTVVDMTELTLARRLADENAERALKADRLLQKAVEVAKVGFFDWDMRDDVFTVSEQFGRDWGVESGVNIGDLFEIIVPEDRAPTQKLVDRASADGQPFQAQYRIRRKTDGRLLWIEAQGLVSMDEAGRPRRFFGTTIDVSDRKELESETLAMVNAIPQLAWMADAGGHLFWYNQRWQDFTGADQEDMRRLGWAPFHHPDHLERATKKWFAHLESGLPWEDTFPLRGINGEWRVFLSRAEPIRDLQGRVTRWFGTNTDITESVRSEKELARLAAVVESSTDFIGMSDAALNPIFINSAAREMVSFGGRDVTKVRVLDFFPPADQARVEAEVVPTLYSEGYWEGELNFRDFESGALIPVLYNLFPIKDPRSGEPLGYATVTRDITERKRLETGLRAAKEEAEQANRAKSAFLANMSHEIRTPLGAIMGFADLAKHAGASPGDLQNYLGVIERNSVQVLRIIDDILDLAKVEAGRVELEKIGFSLVEFLADFSSLMGFRARDNGIRFKLVAATDLPASIVSDPTRLRQILTNAVGNAIKFTTEGAVDLFVSAVGSRLCFRVVDTGRGISPEQKQNLFEAFVQADASTTRKFGGSGLGLVLTRRLCRLMGGDYVLEKSDLGAGSIFSATVEVGIRDGAPSAPRGEIRARQSPSKRMDPGKGRLSGVSVLLVEDSIDNQQLVQLILSRQGARIEVASDGRAGYEKALAGDFDVVLLDIQMPVMDGHETVQKLRADGYAKPVVALTAHAMKEEMERARRSGFTSFLSKPIHKEALIATIRDLTA